MAKKRYYEGDTRRQMESEGVSMIPKDRGIAMMPQSVAYREYPKPYYNMPEGLNDTITGIDRQMRDDMKYKKPINSEKF